MRKKEKKKVAQKPKKEFLNSTLCGHNRNSWHLVVAALLVLDHFDISSQHLPNSPHTSPLLH